MKIVKEHTRGLYVIKNEVFEDNRGFFSESYQKLKLENLGLTANFVQDNESLSMKGVIRGLHFQKPPHAQIKLVRVVHGSVFDVAIDLRKDSPTFGKWFGEILSSDNNLMFWIDKGFAHGFQALEDNTIFQYKCSEYYDKNSECSIFYNDNTIGIQWNDIPAIVSNKDASALKFNEFNSYF